MFACLQNTRMWYTNRSKFCNFDFFDIDIVVRIFELTRFGVAIME